MNKKKQLMMSILCDKCLIIANIIFEGRRINIHPREEFEKQKMLQHFIHSYIYSFIHVFTDLANSYQVPPKPLRL